MVESLAVKEICDYELLRQLYLKVVMEPNDAALKKGFIKCPECGEEILMIPALKKMNEAIENHVKLHKDLLDDNPIQKHNTAMYIRLDLAQQVLQQASSEKLF